MQLNGRTFFWAAALVCVVGVSPAYAATEVRGSMGVFSQYVWRGVAQNFDSPAVQGSLGASTGGLSGSVWFSNSYPAPSASYGGRDVVEFDWTLDYSGSVGKLGYSVGTIHYSYLYDGHSNFTETYLGVSLDSVLSPTLKAYYTVSDTTSGFYKNGDLWVDLGVSGSAGKADLSATISYVSWAADTVNRVADDYQDGLSLAQVGVSHTLAVGDVTVTPSVGLSVPLAGKSVDGLQRIYGTQSEMEFTAGLNVAF
ncbi:MAG: TorF family putative porin [Nitrospirota bacterium]|nr:TorF family putative porin [Nitrospirota bacterium]